MRIHTVAALYVMFFAQFYNLMRSEWAAVVLTCASVLSAEVFNTCVEGICNELTSGYSHFAKRVKDMAAGAVLITALASVLVGIIIFGDIQKIKTLTVCIFTDFGYTSLFVASVVLSVLFIAQPFGKGKRRNQREFK